ncbi:nitroreductase family deazaflavin-dependent oxidoreductase [Rhodococcus sp. NPDC056960]|uniref:nitroreductase family deazaflavin-dependent oxidoreductase n=1 Tax=Rhodococcus sp. NPDC056960 TaxID=3345982 RepID=UPI00363AC657
MPLPEKMAVLPKYLNPVLRPLAAYLPPLAVIHHRGRRSGTPYSSPVQAFRTKSGVVVGLAYNQNPNWARNIIAGGGEITRAGKTYTIHNPQLRGADAEALLPRPVAAMMGRLGITEFFQCDLQPQKK